MTNTPSHLVCPITIPVLRRLLWANLLSEKEECCLESTIRCGLPWMAWLDRGLLSLGAVLVVAGVGYFFAHNWDHLTNNEKLGLAGASVLISFVGATWVGLDRFLGKILLFAASALVGVYIAVFGQIYQTGADSYELFTGWAFLIFPWVALSRFMPLWIFWVGLLNFALGLYWPVSPRLPLDDGFSLFRYETISLFFLNGAALLLREFITRWPLSWFDRGWSALILLTATVVPAGVEVAGEVSRTWEPSASIGNAWLATGLLAVSSLSLGFFYSRIRFSLGSLAIVTLTVCTVLTLIAARVLDFDQPHLGAVTWLMEGLFILVIFGSGVFFLRSQRLSHHHD